MYLHQLEVERYKAYASRSAFRLFPLTILVGSNSSGKSAMARAAALLAGSFLSHEGDQSPLPLQSLGLVHGDTLHDLLWRHSTHGSLELAASFAGTPSGEQARLETVIQALDSLGGDPRPIVARWSLTLGARHVSIERPSVLNEEHLISTESTPSTRSQVAWQGLVPRAEAGGLPDWTKAALAEIRAWAQKVRYLTSPRCLASSPFRIINRGPLSMSPDGEQTPLILAAHDDARAEVGEFFRDAFGVEPDIHREASVGSLGVRQHGTFVGMTQAGQGLTQILPVATMLATAPMLGEGLDIIEHPCAELHPMAHGDVAEFLLKRANRPERPVIVETHSEMILLRVRRWVAERRVDADDVGIYWVEPNQELGSSLRRITLTSDGAVEGWPEGVFYEDYEEVLAIRRAARDRRS